MAEISASMVKELRELSGAGMMDCKKALVECNGDFEAAKDWLRQKGLAKAASKSDRVANEGLIRIHKTDDRHGSMLLLACETDFVARTDDFRQLAKDVALQIASAKPVTVRIEDLPADVVERERRIYEAQVVEQKKPEPIRAKIVEGMLKKFYEENVLLEQKFIKDDKQTVGDLVRGIAAKTGEKVEVRRFARFELGGA